MKGRVPLVSTVGSLAALVGLLMAANCANPKKESNMKDKAEEELLAIEKQSAQAFVRNDAVAIGRYLADDWAIISPDGNVIEKSKFLELIESGVLTHELMEFDDKRVRVYGATAVVTARAASKATFQGQAFDALERSTDVYVKQHGQWKCVLTQLTRIAKK